MQINSTHFLWLVNALCSLFRMPFDANLAAQAFPGPHTMDALIDAAARYGLDLRPKKLRLEKPAAQQVPFMALMHDQPPALLLQADERAVVLASGPR